MPTDQLVRHYERVRGAHQETVSELVPLLAQMALESVADVLPGATAAPVEAASLAPAQAEEPVPPGGVFVQLGAFSVVDNAEAFLARLRREQTWAADSLRLVHGENVHKVQAGPYATREQALATIERARQAGMEAFTVDP